MDKIDSGWHTIFGICHRPLHSHPNSLLLTPMFFCFYCFFLHYCSAMMHFYFLSFFLSFSIFVIFRSFCFCFWRRWPWTQLCLGLAVVMRGQPLIEFPCSSPILIFLLPHPGLCGYWARSTCWRSFSAFAYNLHPVFPCAPDYVSANASQAPSFPSPGCSAPALSFQSGSCTCSDPWLFANLAAHSWWMSGPFDWTCRRGFGLADSGYFCFGCSRCGRTFRPTSTSSAYFRLNWSLCSLITFSALARGIALSSTISIYFWSTCSPTSPFFFDYSWNQEQTDLAILLWIAGNHLQNSSAATSSWSSCVSSVSMFDSVRIIGHSFWIFHVWFCQRSHLCASHVWWSLFSCAFVVGSHSFRWMWGSDLPLVFHR